MSANKGMRRSRRLSPSPPPRKRQCRGCYCFWTTLAIVLLLILALLTGVAVSFSVVLRPRCPSFSVSSIRLSRFRLNETTVTSFFNFTLIARNSNSGIAFAYDEITAGILSDGIEISGGPLPGFIHSPKNVTALKAGFSSSTALLYDESNISALKSSSMRRNLPLEIRMETRVKAKIGNIETIKLRIWVRCEGIRIAIPTGNTASSAATTSNVKCDIVPKILTIDRAVNG